jgi:S-adenosyl-L-methionine hydrolase (adenosine-forming)
MSLVTLTSDFGWRDHSISSLKGAIYTLVPSATIVDISHEVLPHNNIDAAFIFKNSYHHFPPQSIHVIAVDLAGSEKLKLIYTYHEQQHFLMPDNGIISLIFPTLPDPILHIDTYGFPLFISFKQVFSKLIEKIAKNEPIEGPPALNVKKFVPMNTMLYPDMIKGSIVYIDNFDNAVTNISIADFERVQKDRNFEISFGRNRFLSISDSYSSVPEGEKLCLFNSIGLLEIAINKGHASSLLNLKQGSQVMIQFSQKNMFI